MLTVNQKQQYGTYNVSARLDETAYKSMLSLASAAGYEDVNSFVREAVLTKCGDIANALSSLYADRISAYKRK
jgi:uncharacterized protein (DUF1778 family)